jgi:hypothetical protein
MLFTADYSDDTIVSFYKINENDQNSEVYDDMMVWRSQCADVSHCSFDFLQTWVAVVRSYQNNAERTKIDSSS